MNKEVITPLDAPEGFQVEAAVERQRQKAEQHSPVIRALGLAYYWQSLIEAGKFDSFAMIAAAEGISRARVSQVTQLLRCSPERVHALLQSPCSTQLQQITRQDIPFCWGRQREGFSDLAVSRRGSCLK